MVFNKDTVSMKIEVKSHKDNEMHPSVGFLFNHDQLHQAPHSITVLNALVERDRKINLFAYVTDEAQAEWVSLQLNDKAKKQISILLLHCPKLMMLLHKLLGNSLPIARVARLFFNRVKFKSLDWMVVPETTSVLLKSHFGMMSLKLIYTQHGAGDRAVGFQKVLRQFDHVFIAGEKIAQRMRAEKLITPKHYSVIGYPKFDFVKSKLHIRKKVFDNDNPTVLYNPHFDPLLSSWFTHGQLVLEYFAAHPDLNLIVAPHVMLFARRYHLRIKPLKWRLMKSIPDEIAVLPNIHVDTGSLACVDMTYTCHADIYLGDVSSQVYEFLYQPRPCVFINSHNAKWQDDPNYSHWHLGPVIDDIEQLNTHLRQRPSLNALFAETQIEAFEKTFGKSIYGASQRAAQVIENLVYMGHR